MASRPVPIRSGRFLPRDPRVEAPYRLTPQLMFRIGILGFLTFAAFAVLFVRLWSLQVLSGNEFVLAAENNQLQLERVEALRGPIKDRHGRVLVDNTSATAVKILPAFLPKRGQYALVRRLARILNVPLADITSQIEKHGDDRATPVTVKEGITFAEVAYLREHEREFPGVQLANTFIRSYPQGDLAAHILGHVGEISEEQLKSRRGYLLGDKIGQGGIEASFDKELRGRAGLEQWLADSLGRPVVELIERREFPVPGYALRLTLDAKLQRAAQQAVIDGINRAQADRKWYARAGAIVALDPKDGAIRALASYPTYDPAVYTRRKKRDLAPLLDPEIAEASNFPALNRAVAGAYPPGSTFKPVTALAAMQEHILSPYDSLPCTGSLTIDGHKFNNWDLAANSSMTLPTALAQSCDTYFYQVGKRFYDLPGDRQPLQEWAKVFGFGELTGIDVGPETSGLLPTIKWKRETFTKETDPCCWEVDRLWKSGDSVQLAIGQKDMLASPLQMARFYALLANGGKLVTPHLVSAIEQPGPSGGPSAGPLVLRRYQPAAQELNLDPAAIEVIREGLYEATHSSSGTSAGVFGHFPIGIAGKTGTAEKSIDVGTYMRTEDTAWWCGWGPYGDSPELVVCAVIENGGYGGEIAAPAALQVFEEYFGIEATRVQVTETD